MFVSLGRATDGITIIEDDTVDRREREERQREVRDRERRGLRLEGVGEEEGLNEREREKE